MCLCGMRAGSKMEVILRLMSKQSRGGEADTTHIW